MKLEVVVLGVSDVDRAKAFYEKLGWRIEREMSTKTVIVTGASQGIGAGIVRAFLSRGYNVVGTARHATK